MPTTLTPGTVPNSSAAVSAALTATAPAAGDNRTAASVATPLQQLLNVIAVVGKLFNGATLGGLTDFFSHGGTVAAHNLAASNLISCSGNYSGAGGVSCGGDVNATNINGTGNLALSGLSSTVSCVDVTASNLVSAATVGATLGTFNACAVVGTSDSAFTCAGDAIFNKGVSALGATSSLVSNNLTTITGAASITSVPGNGLSFTLTPDIQMLGFMKLSDSSQTKHVLRTLAASINADTSYQTTLVDVVHITNTAAGDLNVWGLSPATGAGSWLKIKHKVGSAHNIVVRDGSVGGTVLATLAAGSGVEIVFDGTNWFAV